MASAVYPCSKKMPWWSAKNCLFRRVHQYLSEVRKGLCQVNWLFLFLNSFTYQRHVPTIMPCYTKSATLEKRSTARLNLNNLATMYVIYVHTLGSLQHYIKPSTDNCTHNHLYHHNVKRRQYFLALAILWNKHPPCIKINNRSRSQPIGLSEKFLVMMYLNTIESTGGLILHLNGINGAMVSTMQTKQFQNRSNTSWTLQHPKWETVLCTHASK